MEKSLRPELLPGSEICHLNLRPLDEDDKKGHCHIWGWVYQGRLVNLDQPDRWVEIEVSCGLCGRRGFITIDMNDVQWSLRKFTHKEIRDLNEPETYP